MIQNTTRILHYLLFFCKQDTWTCLPLITLFEIMTLLKRKYLSMALQPFFEPWPLFQFLDLSAIYIYKPSHSTIYCKYFTQHVSASFGHPQVLLNKTFTLHTS
jgi:hypothetical protein